MAVDYLSHPPVEIWSGRKGSIDAKGVREYQRSFRVRTTSPLDGPLTVRQAGAIPRIGDPYLEANGTALDTGARCIKVDPQVDQNDPYTWLITCDYSSATDQQQSQQGPEGQQGQQSLNPLDRPADISWSFVQFTSAIDQDVNGVAITNSAGDRFDPPLEHDEPRLQLTIKVNRVTYNPLLARDMVNRINKFPYLGFRSTELKLNDMPATSKSESGIFFWEVTFSFHIHPTGWNPVKVLDYGPYQVVKHTYLLGVVTGDLTPPQKRRLTDGRGNPIEDLLDGKGEKLAQGALPKYREFDLYEMKDFSVLGLQ